MVPLELANVLDKIAAVTLDRESAKLSPRINSAVARAFEQGVAGSEHANFRIAAAYQEHLNAVADELWKEIRRALEDVRWNPEAKAEGDLMEYVLGKLEPTHEQCRKGTHDRLGEAALRAKPSIRETFEGVKKRVSAEVSVLSMKLRNENSPRARLPTLDKPLTKELRLKWHLHILEQAERYELPEQIGPGVDVNEIELYAELVEMGSLEGNVIRKHESPYNGRAVNVGLPRITAAGREYLENLRNSIANQPHAELDDFVRNPVELTESLKALRSDFPDPVKVCFIMMRFGKTKAHTEITNTIKVQLKRHGIQGVRADDKHYHDDLFWNIATYMHGCGFGIAVFERLEQEEFNPNVALEVGYMLALGKPVFLLKDNTLKSLTADLVGKLYRLFDPQDITGTIPEQVTRWLSDKKLDGREP